MLQPTKLSGCEVDLYQHEVSTGTFISPFYSVVIFFLPLTSLFAQLTTENKLKHKKIFSKNKTKKIDRKYFLIKLPQEQKFSLNKISYLMGCLPALRLIYKLWLPNDSEKTR